MRFTEITRRVRSRGLIATLCVVGLLALSCTSLPQQPSRGSGDQPAERRGPKTLRTAVVDEPRTGIALFSAGGTGGPDPGLMFHSGLTVYDDRGEPTPRLAQKVPSLDDGDWRVMPDGRMEITWKLRPNVKWHDGMPLDHRGLPVRDAHRPG